RRPSHAPARVASRTNPRTDFQDTRTASNRTEKLAGSGRKIVPPIGAGHRRCMSRTALSFVALAWLSATAFADNEIRAVTFDQDGSATRVIVKSAQTPTFTVFKLEKPARVVIDVPNAHLAPALVGHDTSMSVMPQTWAVNAVSAQQQEDGSARVVITLARPGNYDVKTNG